MSKHCLTIVHLYPELLNLYGDTGNVEVLEKRMAWRGLPVQVDQVHVGDAIDFTQADIICIGGGTDREQQIVAEHLFAQKDQFKSFVEDGGCLLAVCGGYQLLGDHYLLGDEKIQGLSLVDMHTGRGAPRLIGDIAIQSSLCQMPIVGYENHGGRTYLGEGVQPLGKVIVGHGNDGTSGYEGILYKNVVGTYIHGPLLPKNPQVADWLLARALERRGESGELQPLDDRLEIAANQIMFDRLIA